MAEKIISLIFGKRGSGKSYLAAHLLQQHDRYFIYDTLGEYTDGVIFDNISDLSEFWKSVYRDKFKIIYRPTQPAAEFNAITKLVWKCKDLAFLVEEIDTFGTPYKIEEDFANIIQRGRHRHITLIGVTQRPFGINRLLTSQAKQVFIFNSNEPRDRIYLKEFAGAEIIAQLDSLEQYEFCVWKDKDEKITIAKVGIKDEKPAIIEKI